MLAMMLERLRRGDLLVPLYCVAAVAINQSLFRLGALSLEAAIGFAAAVVLVAFLSPTLSYQLPKRAPFGWTNLLIGGVIVTPLLVVFGLGWNREFPYSGDHYFHVGQAYRLAFWWLSPPASVSVRVPTLADVYSLFRHPLTIARSRITLLAAIVVLVVAVYRRHRLAALGLAVAGALVWGGLEQTLFVRYPAGGYFLTIPLLGPALLLHNVELAGRVTNVLSPLLWLFALRPWLLGRWPDLRVVTVGLLLFWQKDVIYYFNSVYMEPWAITFCLLAIELLIARDADGGPLACLFVGAAAMVKEPFIFALPFVWLAGAPWRQNWVALCRLSGCALAAGVTFVAYFVARSSLAVDAVETSRDFHFSLPSPPLMPYVREFAYRLMMAFPSSDGWLWLVALMLLPATLMLIPGRRLAMACFMGSGLLLVVFFWVDRESLTWLGYFRFLLPALPFLAAGTLAFGHWAPLSWTAVTAVVALAWQVPSAFTAISLAAGPPTDLNFVEAYDAPIFFPIKALLATARAQELLPAGTIVAANAPDTSLRPLPGIPVTFGPPGELYCECNRERPAVMTLFVRFANLDAAYGHTSALPGAFGPPPERLALWQATDAAKSACVARLRQTCGHVLSHVEGRELVGLLGVR